MPAHQATANETPSERKNKHTRWIFAPLLILAVIALMIFAARTGIPSAGGIHRDPAETAPASPAHR